MMYALLGALSAAGCGAAWLLLRPLKLARGVQVQADHEPERWGFDPTGLCD